MRRFVSTVAFLSLLIAEAGPAWAQTIPSTFLPVLPNTFVYSLVRAADGNLWFSGIETPQGQFGYVARLTPAGTITYFPAPLRIVAGGAQPTLPLSLAEVTANDRRRTHSLVFNWVAVNAQAESYDESGLGSIDLDRPAQMREFAAQDPGDPLYRSQLSLDIGPFNDGLATTLSLPKVWTYAHASPTASASPEKVQALSYPLGSLAGARAYPIGSETFATYSGFNTLVGGDGDDLWYLDFAGSAIGRIDASGAHEYALGLEPYSLAAGTGAHLWVGGFGQSPDVFRAERISLTGAVDGVAVAPPMGFDIFQPLAAGSYGMWSPNFDTTLGLFYFMRLSETGQWSWYATPSPLGTVRPEITVAAAVGSDGTVWENLYGVAGSPPHALSGLLGFKPPRFIETQPQQLALASPASPAIPLTVRETAASGAPMTSTVPEGCPLAIRRTAPHAFLVSATSTIPNILCGVTISDGAGVFVWVPLVNPSAPSTSEDARRNSAEARARVIEKFGTRPPIGRY